MRVVLVDPSRTMRLFVTRLLKAGEHTVEPFADGPEALACMQREHDIGALITSGELITMSGLELCWETRVLAGRDRPIYVILMSSSIDKSKLGEALDSGADDFISKPPIADELYARLRAAERLGGMQRELVRLASVDSRTSSSQNDQLRRYPCALPKLVGYLCQFIVCACSAHLACSTLRCRLVEREGVSAQPGRASGMREALEPDKIRTSPRLVEESRHSKARRCHFRMERR